MADGLRADGFLVALFVALLVADFGFHAGVAFLALDLRLAGLVGLLRGDHAGFLAGDFAGDLAGLFPLYLFFSGSSMTTSPTTAIESDLSDSAAF